MNEVLPTAEVGVGLRGAGGRGAGGQEDREQGGGGGVVVNEQVLHAAAGGVSLKGCGDGRGTRWWRAQRFVVNGGGVIGC